MTNNNLDETLLLRPYEGEIQRVNELVGVKHGDIPARTSAERARLDRGGVGVKYRLEIRLITSSLSIHFCRRE